MILILLVWCALLTCLCAYLWYGVRTGKNPAQLEAKVQKEVAAQVAQWKAKV